MACHRVTLCSRVVIWLMIPCGLPQGSSLATSLIDMSKLGLLGTVQDDPRWFEVK
uniref:Uncharacterized protein n=1 Tax=Candidatus Methanophaga sp. ANME-1 ERB7 TaxID=2759913 RepID=A0A7G9ZBV2_9EURY|nr:hypothetical protein GBAFDLPJ_00030 [Methanosarcinales archaeon ANME-1 ERB7]